MAVGTAASVVGALGSLLGPILDPIFSAKAAKTAFRRQKTMMKNMVSWRVQDLKKAGLNPILAVQGGLQPSTASVQQAAPSHFGQSIPGAVRSTADAISKFAPQLVPRQFAEIANIESNTMRTDAQTLETDFRRKYLLPLQMQEIGSRAGLQWSAEALNRQRQKSEEWNTQLRSLDMPEAQSRARFFQDAGSAKMWAEMLGGLSRSIR